MAEPIVALEELSIELSNYCLMRCVHCSSGSQPVRQPGELKHHEIVRIIQEARLLGATVLSLSGGDPIVYSGAQHFSDSIVGHVSTRFLNATEYVALARELGYERVLFYTTGIWSIDLDQLDMPGAEPLGALWGMDAWPYLDDLIDAGRGVLTVIFSLDSHRPDVHDFIRGVSGAWYTTTGSIMALTSVGVNVEVHMVPMKPNYTHISNVRDICADMGVSKLSLLRFVPQTRGFDNLGLLDMSVEEFEDMQYILDAEACEGGLAGDLYPHAVEMRPGCPIDFRHTIGATAYKMKSCHAGLDLILVRPDGSVHPCAAWKTLPDDANIRTVSLEDIWENATTFCALREFHTVGYERLPAPCGTCAALDSCKGGCPAQRLHAHGKTWEDIYYPASDPLCPIGAI